MLEHTSVPNSLVARQKPLLLVGTTKLLLIRKLPTHNCNKDGQSCTKDYPSCCKCDVDGNRIPHEDLMRKRVKGGLSEVGYA